MKNNEIPGNVKNAPADPDGNGFVVLGVIASSVVGDDGECYTRKNGVISIAQDDED